MDEKCDFLFVWGGGKEIIQSMVVACVRKNELLRINDFLFYDWLILPIDCIFQNYNQWWIPIVNFCFGGRRGDSKLEFGDCVKENKLLKISK